MKREKKKESKRILLALGWYRYNLHRGVARFCRENGWALDLLSHSPQLINQGIWDGAIVTMQAPELAPVFRHVGNIVTLVSQPEHKRTYPCVTQDLDEVGRLAAIHLQERGYRHLAYYAQSDEISGGHYRGFHRTAHASGSTCHKLFLPKRRPARYKGQPHWHRAWLVDKLRPLAKPLGILAENDQMGVEIIDACRQKGLSVPEDVAVVGVDNEELLCECAPVPLSSVDSNLDELGYRAAQLLSEVIDEKNKVEPVLDIVKARGVIVRHSSDTLVSYFPEAAAAMQIIVSNCHDHEFDIADLAAIMGQSRRAIERTIKKHCGCAPGELLYRTRMRRAQYLLKFTDWDVCKISAASGYGIPQNFHRAFRKHAGVTPSVYRKSL